MRLHLKSVLTAALFSVCATVACAAPLSFDLTGQGGQSSGLTVQSGDVSLTVTAGAFIDGWWGVRANQQDNNNDTIRGYVTETNSFDPKADVIQGTGGLGVVNNNSGGCVGGASCMEDNFAAVDGSGWDDFLILSFSREVQIDAVSLSDFSADDHYRLFFDLNGDGSLGNDDFLSFRRDANDFADFPSLNTSLIGFVATGAVDRWTLQSVTASPAPIPLPATGLLLLAGFGGLAALRRRR